MAAAKKCNVCGTFYDNYNMDNHESNGLKLTNEYVHNNNYLEYYDCCPDCMRSIKKYIESLKCEKEKKDDMCN